MTKISWNTRCSLLFDTIATQWIPGPFFFLPAYPPACVKMGLGRHDTRAWGGGGGGVSIAIHMWQAQVENEHYSTLSGLFRLVISLECFIEITPDFLCPFIND